MRYMVVCVWVFALLAAAARGGGGFYSPSDDVVELSPSNFQREVSDSASLWLVEFYAPWCGHCQKLTPEWKRAAAALKGVVKVGAVDAEQHKELAGRFAVGGFPAIKVFGADKTRPEDYRGGPGSQAIVDAALKAARALVKDRLGGAAGGKSGGSEGGSGGGGRSGGDTARSGGASGKTDVVELTDANFDQLVLGGGDGDAAAWMVAFVAPWCGHCMRLEPEWAAAAAAVREQTKGKVRLGAVDATVHQALAGRYGVRGFPTIKIFREGEAEPKDYRGGRSRSEIVAKAVELLADAAPTNAAELLEIVGEEVWTKACEERQMCVVSFLPHILDSGAAGRKAYLELLRRTAERHRRKAWGWLWAEAGAQSHLEASLGVEPGFGYPAMAALNVRRTRSAVLRGSFSESGIAEFLGDLAAGRRGSASSAAATVGGITKIHTVEAWDGKDGQLPLVEEYDLSNVEL